MTHWAYGHLNKTPQELDTTALEKTGDKALLNVDDVDDAARTILRTVCHTIDKLDGGEPDGTLSPDGKGRSPSVRKLDAALELLYGKDGLMEILDKGDGDDPSELRDMVKGTAGLETTTPEFAAMSLSTRVNRLFADGKCTAQERDQQRHRLWLDPAAVRMFCEAREPSPVEPSRTVRSPHRPRPSELPTEYIG